MPITPAENELTAALVQIKKENPSLGVSKVHALLLKTYPDWIVSEKRAKKILQLEGLTTSALPADPNAIYPSSRVIQSLDVNKWTNKVKVKMFDKRKGKGLVASVAIPEGDLIWKEDPFIVAAEWCVSS